MKKTMILFAVLSATGWGADFALSIGSPSAALLPGSGAPVTKKTTSVLAVRAENCADASKLELTARAESLVNGVPQSAALRVIPGSMPGAYLIARDTPAQGSWVVNLSGSCGGAKAGALVPIGPAGFMRESAKFFPRSATDAEVQAALKALEGGTK